MEHKVASKLIESKFSKHNLNTHWKKHQDQFNYDSAEEYDERAEEISKMPAGASYSKTYPVIGYKTKRDGRKVKYVRATGELVIYSEDNKYTISYYKCSYDEYLNFKENNYGGEL